MKLDVVTPVESAACGWLIFGPRAALDENEISVDEAHRAVTKREKAAPDLAYQGSCQAAKDAAPRKLDAEHQRAVIAGQFIFVLKNVRAEQVRALAKV